MWTWHIEKGLSQEQQGQYSKHIYLGETRIVTKQTSDLEEHYGQSEELHHQYYYHPDHLGSAQLVTDYEGNEYQRIEYTPYGELWVEKKTANEKDMRYLPYKFTAKEQDEETGLYYYGARYLDAKYSRWLSTDPAVSDYVPQAPVNDEARKHNQNLPGMGGVFNIVNLQLYHYAGNNPVKYVDPDGRSEDLGGGLDDHCTVRRTEEGKHVIVDGGKKYNYVEANLVNYLNTGDERYFNKLPITSDPLGVSGIFAFVEDYLGGSGDTNNKIDFTGTKSNIVFGLGIAIASSTGGNRDKEQPVFPTTKEATAAAKELGFSKTNYFSDGRPVYKKGNLYITPDRTSHNGGVWKMADSVGGLKSRSTRMGTYDANLNRIGD